MKHLIAFLGYSQSRIQHPAYRQFVQGSLVKRNAALLYQSHPLEERELVREVNELQRREGMPCEFCFHICATLDDPTMGKQVIQAITLIRRLYDRPSYVYCLLPNLETCTEEQKKNAWECLVSINNGITDYPEVHLLSHCFLYHDTTQVSLAHFLYDITQEEEALEIVDRYGYLNKLHRPKTSETVCQVEFPSIFSSFNGKGISYPDEEIRYYMHQSYLNALLGLSRQEDNPVSMEQCNEHVQQLLSRLPLSEELVDLTGESFIKLNPQSGFNWLPVEKYWQQVMADELRHLQDKPREEWVNQLQTNLEACYQARYRNMGVDSFYSRERKMTPDYCLVLLDMLKQGLQQILLNTTYPPETSRDIVRSIVNHLQLLSLHFSSRHTELTKSVAQAKTRLQEIARSLDGFGFFNRMRGKDKVLFEEYRTLIAQYYIDRVKLQGADFAVKLLNEFIPQVSAFDDNSEHLSMVCREANEVTRRYLDDNPVSEMEIDFPVKPILDAIWTIRLDVEHLRADYRFVNGMLYGPNPPLNVDDFLQRLRYELTESIDRYLDERIQDGTLPPVLGVSIIDRVAALYANEEDGMKKFVDKLKNDTAISLKLKGNGGHKEQYLLIAPECGGQLGPQIVSSEHSSLEMLHILTGISLDELEGFAGQRMFVEPSIF